MPSGVTTRPSRYRPDAVPDYSHRFHAGNVGDVWKHCALVEVVRQVAARPSASPTSRRTPAKALRARPDRRVDRRYRPALDDAPRQRVEAARSGATSRSAASSARGRPSRDLSRVAGAGARGARPRRRRSTSGSATPRRSRALAAAALAPSACASTRGDGLAALGDGSAAPRRAPTRSSSSSIRPGRRRPTGSSCPTRSRGPSAARRAPP